MTMNQGVNAAMDSRDATTKLVKGGPSRGLLIGGLVAVVVIAGVILTTNKSDAPRSGTAVECAASGINCTVGDIGPGGGKVFYLGDASAPATCSGSCLEVAPKTWFGPGSTSDPGALDWTGATSLAAAYGTSTAKAGSWRLPTQNELLNLMTVSRYWSPVADPADAFGFTDGSYYWSSTTSSYYDTTTKKTILTAYVQTRADTPRAFTRQTNFYLARPIHAF